MEGVTLEEFPTLPLTKKCAIIPMHESVGGGVGGCAAKAVVGAILKGHDLQSLPSSI